MCYLEGNDILYRGFRKYKSCEIQLISLLHDLARNLDQRIQTDIISVDFSKAFDAISHCRLLYNLDWSVVYGKDFR